MKLITKKGKRSKKTLRVIYILFERVTWEIQSVEKFFKGYNNKETVVNILYMSK